MFLKPRRKQTLKPQITSLKEVKSPILQISKIVIKLIHFLTKFPAFFVKSLSKSSIMMKISALPAHQPKSTMIPFTNVSKDSLYLFKADKLTFLRQKRLLLRIIRIISTKLLRKILTKYRFNAETRLTMLLLKNVYNVILKQVSILTSKAINVPFVMVS